MKLASATSMAASGGEMDGSDGGKGGDDRKRKGVSLKVPSDDEELVDDVKMSSSEDEDDDDEDDDYDDEDDDYDDAPAALKKKSNEANSKGGRGLSRSYIGKSKSNEKLDALDIKASKDVGKEEHPLNKKRRLHIAKERRRDFLSDATSAMGLATATATSLTGSNEGSASMASARAAASVQTTESSASMLPVAVKKKRRGVTKKVVWSKITLVREQNNESRSRNQNRLTRLGKNVIAWKRLSYKKRWRMTPDLKPHRMDRLKNAKVLRIRNQRDIEAVVYLIKHCCFNNKIQVPDIDMLKHVKKKLTVFLRKNVKFSIRACESDDDSYRASDRENDSADRYDSDACVREVQEEESSAPPDFDVDFDYDAMTYLENEDGSESDTNDNYGNDTDESGSD